MGDSNAGALYGDLAPWFYLLTPPEDYADEAAFTLELLYRQVSGPLETLLELGSGGGNMASHLMTTAFEHLRPGGAAVFEPDHTRETFAPGTDHGGEDGPLDPRGRPGRALRYLEWTIDPDPSDATYKVDYALLLREADGSVEARHDQHLEGLFARRTWLDLLAVVGFRATWVEDPEGRIVFIGIRPGDEAPTDPA